MRYLLQLHGNLPACAYPDIAVQAESLGFEDLTVHDVLLRRPVWPLLCEIARVTDRIQVGPNVTHPYLNHPVKIAANIAHLDEVSNGRAVLGIGRGSMYDLIGMDPPTGGLTGLREAIDIIRLLTQGGAGPYAGQVFDISDNARLMFGTPRRVPVYLGALGPRGARFAGRHCDGLRVAAQWDPTYLSSLREEVARGATERGRAVGDVDLVAENWTCLHPDRDVARRHARKILATFLPHLGPLLDFHRIPAAEVEAARAAAGHEPGRADEISDRTLDLFMAAGDASDLRAGLERLAAANIDAVSFSGELGPDPSAAMQLIADVINDRNGQPGVSPDMPGE